MTPVAYPAATAIDWTKLGPTVGERDKPLADKTQDRIRRGLAKFADFPPVQISPDGQLNAILATAAGNTSERPGQTRARPVAGQMFSQTATLTEGVASMPFVVEMRGGGSVAAGQHPGTGQMHTVTAGGLHHGLTVSAHTKQNGGPGDTSWHGVDAQIGTITGKDTTGIMSLPMTMPLVHGNSNDRYRHVFEQLATLTTARERYVATAPLGDVDIDNVHFRMLDPATELRKAMAFPDEFMVLGTKTQITRGMGNAVTPPVATWIIGRVLATLG